MLSFGQQSAPATGFGSFGFGANISKPNNPTFGTNMNNNMNINNNPITTNTPFGGFTTNTTNSATSLPNTGFGFGKSPGLSTTTTITGQQQPSTSSFGFNTQNTQHPTSLPGFGMTTQNFGTQITSAQPQSGFGSGFAMTSQSNPMNINMNDTIHLPLGVDTPYKSLPAPIQSSIIDIYKNYKKPMRETLSVLSRVQDRKIETLNESMQHTQLATARLIHKFESLVEGVNILHQQVKDINKGLYNHCVTGSQEIKQKHSNSFRSIKSTDIDLLYPILEQLDEKLSQCSYRIKQLTYHYSLLSDTVNGMTLRKRGEYGQRIPVGPQQLLQLIKHQNDALFKIAGFIADIHKEAEEVKRRYLLLTEQGSGSSLSSSSLSSSSSSSVRRHVNPFVEAELQKEKDRKRLMQILRVDIQEASKGKLLGSQASTNPSIGPFQPSSSSSSFGFSQGLNNPTQSLGGFGLSGVSGSNTTNLGNTAFGRPPTSFSPVTTSITNAATAATTGNNNSFGGIGGNITGPSSLSLQLPSSSTTTFTSTIGQSGGTLNALDLAKPNTGNGFSGFTQPPPSTPMPSASQKKNRARR